MRLTATQIKNGIGNVLKNSNRTLSVTHDPGRGYVVKYVDPDRVPIGVEMDAPGLVSEDAWCIEREFDRADKAEMYFNFIRKHVLPYWFDVLGYYGEKHQNGRPLYETVTCEPSRRMAQESVRLYRQNEPFARFKIRKIRAASEPN